MNKEKVEKNSNIFPATVVENLDSYRIAINRGKNDGIKLGDIFIVFRISSEEIIDPETKESLGRLEDPIGTGTVINVQEKMSVLKSNRKEKGKKTIIREGMNFGRETITEVNEPEIELPFKYVSIGDKAKPI